MSERTMVLGGYGLTADSPEVRGRRNVTLPVSMALHSAAAVALLVIPLLVAEEIPEPHSGVRAFLVEPLSVAPPPPPPPARAAAAPRVEPKPQPQSQAIVAPVEVPTEITPEAAIDLGGLDAGSPDGVEGGVPGGVVGGIVGGLPDAPPPPAAPIRVGGAIREPKRIVSVPPVYPELAVMARLQGTVVVEATLNERGRVVNVSLVQGAPLLTQSALDAVSKWVYTPTLVNGVPTPVIMTVTVRFRLNGPLG
ncbi:MAG TPA: TonB family protein [Vicinamibacteria bacterium]